MIAECLPCQRGCERPEARHQDCLISEFPTQSFTHKYLVIHWKSFSTIAKYATEFLQSLCSSPVNIPSPRVLLTTRGNARPWVQCPVHKGASETQSVLKGHFLFADSAQMNSLT